MTDFSLLIEGLGGVPPSPDDYESAEVYQAVYDAWFAVMVEEFGAAPPSPDDYETAEVYQAVYATWLEKFSSFLDNKEKEREAARIAAEEEAHRQAEEEEAARQSGGEEGTGTFQTIQLPETEERYPIGSYIDENGMVWDPSGSLLSPEVIVSYPSGIYADAAGNFWSEDGELLSPGTTPAMEPVHTLAGEVTGEPAADTALLLLDLLDAITSEDGMMEDIDGVQKVLDHPLMTTSFQDYTVTEGLLLLLLLSVFIAACARILKGGFSWLR